MSEPTVIPVIVRCERPNTTFPKGQTVFVFADDFRASKDQLLLGCFSFAEGHNEMCYEYYRRSTFKLDDVSADRQLAQMQKYYDSLPGDPIQLKRVHRMRFSNN